MEFARLLIRIKKAYDSEVMEAAWQDAATPFEHDFIFYTDTYRYAQAYKVGTAKNGGHP